MAGLLELILVLAAAFAAIWLPGAAVIGTLTWLRAAADRPAHPAPGPAMDL